MPASGRSVRSHRDDADDPAALHLPDGLPIERLGQGEGEVTQSEQARADALADAETLRRNWAHRGTLDEPSSFNALLTNLLWESDPAERGWLANLAAHCAFLTVPGLRGE